MRGRYRTFPEGEKAEQVVQARTGFLHRGHAGGVWVGVCGCVCLCVCGNRGHATAPCPSMLLILRPFSLFPPLTHRHTHTRTHTPADPPHRGVSPRARQLLPQRRERLQPTSVRLAGAQQPLPPQARAPWGHHRGARPVCACVVCVCGVCRVFIVPTNPISTYTLYSPTLISTTHLPLHCFLAPQYDTTQQALDHRRAGQRPA
jgi:hypothetical protein